MMNDRRFPASSERLDKPERLVWLPPAEVIAALAAHTGEAIADVGAGTDTLHCLYRAQSARAERCNAVDGKARCLPC